MAAAAAAGDGSAASRGDPLTSLRSFEREAIARTDFARAETSETAFGPDPYVVRVGGPGKDARVFGILRGRSVLVELDANLHEVARVAAPRSPTGLAVGATGDLFVAGELSGDIERYRQGPGGLKLAGTFHLPAHGLRDVAVGPEGVLYAVEEHDGRLFTLAPDRKNDDAQPAILAQDRLCHGPLRVRRVADMVLVDCLLDHAIVARRVDSAGVPLAQGETRIVHDGPMWAFDAIEARDGIWVAVGGVEDHPLDRTGGSFGFVDSFVTLYRVAGGVATKRAESDTSALGLVTPKALRLQRDAAGHLSLAVAAYGSDRLAQLTWNEVTLASRGPLVEPAVMTRTIPPGSASLDRLPDGSLVIANPLLDAWVRVGPEHADVVRVDDWLAPRRTVDSQLGEALFYTTLMAPWDRSDGKLSRFTCETCHFEGYVDGRTHHTGRGNILATTKPLVGLLGNRPYFSRALDPDMTTMVNNEFRVASANSGHDSWFSIATRDFPWTRELGLDGNEVTPVALRRALMTYLMEATHRPNPATVGRTECRGEEREGAEVFRQKCETCHQARLAADDPATRLPFAAWQAHIFSDQDPIVWASSDYARTGVLPYVNENGARVVPLRRLYKKYPYFTNGSAHGIPDVLDRVRITANGGFAHDGNPDWGVPLEDREMRALEAFLDLL
ncbi:MAG: hypothetical protein ACRENE_20845 [Polyangiaceae bacterium]